MASTRYKYDDVRTQKALQQATGPCRYMLSVPGNGDRPAYVEDPHIVLQKWAGNVWTERIDLESSLRGANRPLSRDCLGKDEYTAFVPPQSQPQAFPSDGGQLSTDQSRATHPAWWYRSLQREPYQYLWRDPQQHAIIPFAHEGSTRLVEKDRQTVRRDQLLRQTNQHV